jgi:hypothetical protein
MLEHARFASIFALALLTAAGCSAGQKGDPSQADDAVETMSEGDSLDAVFDRAAGAHHVPAELLKAVAWAETRAQMVAGGDELEGLAPAFGLMALRGEQIEQGAALTGLDPAAVQSEPEPNVRAAAALMSDLADTLGIDRAPLGAWAPVVAAQSGIESFAAQVGWVWDDVYGTLHEGVEIEGFHIDPNDVVPSFPVFDSPPTPGPDYAGSIWRPSPNYSSRPSGNTGVPHMVVIHTCEGSYSGCWDWLTRSASQVSAHYVVNSTGSEISQLVRESKKAWHVAATYHCSLNGGQECGLDGVASNSFTIGIEHAGYESQSSWSAGLLDASAALVCNITHDQGIPIDSYHVVAHGTLQPYNRIDPGPNWPWADYLAKANADCGAAPPDPPAPPDDPNDPNPPSPDSPLSIVIDSNQAANGAAAQIVVSSKWTASTNVAGYYNTGYYWRSTGPTTDLAQFKAYLAAPKSVIVEAWWPAASDRATEAPFVIFDAQGNQLDTVLVNQQQSGGQWVQLGTYNFTAGWNVIALSRWTAPGHVVVADAVRVREAT